MAVYDVLPSQNLKYEDVRDTLASSGGYVNNNMDSLFQLNSGINQWSKYKPVGFSQNFTDNYPNWYKGNDGKCGMNISRVLSNVEDLIEQYKVGTWIYNPPSGGSAEPYRLGDFRGYSKNAVPFFRSGIKKGQIIEVNVERNNVVLIQGQYSESATSLNISDFDQLGEGLQDAHLGLMMFDYDPLMGGKLLYTQISSTSIRQNGGITLTFSGNDVGTGRYIVLFLASVTVSNNICIPYDDNNYWMVKVEVIRKPLIEVDIKSFGIVGGITRYMDYWKTNPFPSNNGNADILINTNITNTYDSELTIGTTNLYDYNIRSLVEQWTKDAILCDSEGNSIGTSISIPGNSSKLVYLRFNGLFEGFVNSLLGTQGSTYFSLEVKSNRVSGLQGYQTVTPLYTMLISKSVTE